MSNDTQFRRDYLKVTLWSYWMHARHSLGDRNYNGESFVDFCDYHRHHRRHIVRAQDLPTSHWGFHWPTSFNQIDCTAIISISWSSLLNVHKKGVLISASKGITIWRSHWLPSKMPLSLLWVTDCGNVGLINKLQDLRALLLAASGSERNAIGLYYRQKYEEYNVESTITTTVRWGRKQKLMQIDLISALYIASRKSLQVAVILSMVLWEALTVGFCCTIMSIWADGGIHLSRFVWHPVRFHLSWKLWWTSRCTE